MENKATDHLKDKIASNIKVEKQLLQVIEAIDQIEAIIRNLASKIIQENDLNNPEDIRVIEED